MNSKVGIGLILHGYEEAISLSGCKIEYICFHRLSIDTVHFDNSHSVPLYPQILSGKGSHVHDTEHVCLSWLNFDLEGLSVVHQGSIWDRLGSCGICIADEALEQSRRELVVPVSQRENDFFIVQIFDWRIRIVDNERPS